MSSGIKIQINSLEALERLIGGDTSIEMQIRSSIVQEFTKKHLKSLATTDLINNLGSAVKKEIIDTFFTEIKGSGWSPNYYSLNDRAKDILKKECDWAVDGAFRELIQQEIGAHKTREEIKKHLEYQSDYIVNELSKSNLQARLDKMVDAKLKEKLGLK